MQICYILCKMAEKFKSTEEIALLAATLKARRTALGLTLKDIEKSQGINCGQLSRFEAGIFKTGSKNLQKLCIFLQIGALSQPASDSTLGARLERFARHSPQHRAAAEELLRALERFG